MRQVNLRGLNLIKASEGLRLRSYQDVGGLWTVGYGHTPAEPEQNITEDQANELLHRDLIHVEQAILSQITVPLTDNQFSALCCLAFNIGTHNFYDSTLKKLLNQGKYQEASNWFLPWCKVHGVEIEGLVHRRDAERKLFLTPDDQNQAP